ncbi:conserved oligomeric Golgi complex subunit 1 isoform X4 [Octopus sinensis]|uniref:Conserved oligomeric Golgi complex subunit 1 n=1 Tax=Octopus sinensis TaxID=2607531 RepID=A0A7E6FE36_9MOLL|nr:conserved oligomeric Golgi complex subunit 1 isoform X3 [Octopus sinensis]XP_036366017.1 conserved oligomeric Golgi complex subunit 1 isoform X4 [Octopus sinensis]
MASKKPVQNLPLHEMDTNLMFEKYTIQEIREIEKKNRLDIERKKEELRIMVGERYRDLIEAADTITDMKKSSQNVMNSISKIEELCKQLKQNHLAKGTSYIHRPLADKSRKQTENHFYSVASQIKLLLDMPEKMWSAVDSQEFLLAAQAFLLSRHVHTGLQLEAQCSASILSCFPVLSRQWTAISHFKATILQGCRKLLREVNATDQQIADALCSILLLEDCTPRQVFNEFLLARTNAVQQLFHVSQQGIGIKQQICLVVQLIVKTVHQIYTVFYTSDSEVPASESSNLYSILEHVTKTTPKSIGLLDQIGSVSANYLPNSVIDFHPTLRATVTAISVQHLQENCQQWIESCIQSVKAGVTKLLGFVNTVKRLADIRKAVWDLLLQETNFPKWQMVCEKIFINGQVMSVWSVFLQPQFVDRIKSLIQYQLDSTAELTKRHLSKVVMELASPDERSMFAEVDLAKFIWIESPADIPPNTAWIPASQKTLSSGGGLLMKACTYTPTIQSLCKTFNDKLKTMLEDVTPYLNAEGETSNSQPSPFDQLADSPEIKGFVKKSTENCIIQVLEYISEQMQLWKKSLEEIQDQITNEITINKVILVGRFCYALTDLCPHLYNCITAVENSEKEIKLHTLKSKATPVDSAWENIQSMLSERHLDSCQIWVTYTSSSRIQQFRNALCTQTASDIISTITKWDEVDIEEETETGERIKSTIRVPMQASPFVQNLLYATCLEINRVFGHVMKRQVLQDMVTQIFDGVLDCYEHLLKNTHTKHLPLTPDTLALNQQRALQLLFDLKFIALIIPPKGDKTVNVKNRIKKIMDQLEEYIDPFDLDVFTPYVQSHLQKTSQRTMVRLTVHYIQDTLRFQSYNINHRISRRSIVFQPYKIIQ